MEFLRLFWDAAVALDPGARALDEGVRFPLCRPEPLRVAFEAAGLQSVSVEPITVPTTFSSFADFWTPFVDGPGPAPTYVSSLSDGDRQRLAEQLESSLGHDGRSPIQLRARAWVARGVRGTT
jgi:hypothetical protein